MIIDDNLLTNLCFESNKKHIAFKKWRVFFNILFLF